MGVDLEILVVDAQVGEAGAHGGEEPVVGRPAAGEPQRPGQVRQVGLDVQIVPRLQKQLDLVSRTDRKDPGFVEGELHRDAALLVGSGLDGYGTVVDGGPLPGSGEARQDVRIRQPGGDADHGV